MNGRATNSFPRRSGPQAKRWCNAVQPCGEIKNLQHRRAFAHDTVKFQIL